MSALEWYYNGDDVSAASCMHDDGDHFHYAFTKLRSGWHNDTDNELLTGPYRTTFVTLEDAKRWAQSVEAYWLRAAHQDGAA